MINRNEAQMVQKIEELLGDMALNFRQICDLLAGLDRHYLHRDPMFRWYREIAGGKLAPELVMAMCRAQNLIKHMVGRPRDVQMTLAHDGEFDWVREVKGEIEIRRGSWRQMSQAEFKRMFPIGGPIRSVQEQRAILQAEIAAQPVTHIRRQPLARVDLKAGTFTLGNQVVPLTVVIGALSEAGCRFDFGPCAEDHLSTEQYGHKETQSAYAN
jgi:hypothetical protein